MIESKEIEEWRDVPGYEGRYQVSNFGNVKTLTREVTEHRRTYVRKGKILNKYFSGRKDRVSKYYKVKLYNGDRTFKNVSVHRLVAELFIGNPNNLPEINHIDGNPKNNNVSNLEFCTKEYNVKHAYDTGLKKPENYKGSGNSTAKLNEEKVLEIREKYKKGVSCKQLSKEYGVVPGTIGFIVSNQTWTHI